MHEDPAAMLSAMRDAGRWLPLSRRSTAVELLDGGELPRRELERNLDDLARLNRLPGGRDASIRAIGHLLSGRRTATVLDVGTGQGDLPVAFASRGWDAIGLDADPVVAAVARDRVAGTPAVRIVAGDARDLPLPDASVDVAHCSLLLHHLDPSDAIRVLREMARVARIGVVINDLRRGVVPLLATATAVTVLGRCRTTRHDGIVSVLRAYRLGELDALLNDAGLRTVARTWSWMPRVVTTAVPAHTQ